jgi:hypothetical protein
MNKTQRTALVNLIAFVIMLTFGLFLLGEILILKTLVYRVHYFYALVIAIITVLGLLFIFKKQSPGEVEHDERDKIIQLKAALASFVSVWILIAATLFIARSIAGIEGEISIWLLTLVNLVIFLAAMVVYSASIMIQYGFGNSHGEE